MKPRRRFTPASFRAAYDDLKAKHGTVTVHELQKKLGGRWTTIRDALARHEGRTAPNAFLNFVNGGPLTTDLIDTLMIHLRNALPGGPWTIQTGRNHVLIQDVSEAANTNIELAHRRRTGVHYIEPPIPGPAINQPAAALRRR